MKLFLKFAQKLCFTIAARTNDALQNSRVYLMNSSRLTNLARFVNVTGHNTNLALARLDNTRAVRTNQTGLVLSQ